VLEHEPTERAADEAVALGVALEEVAKTLVVTTPEANVRAVLPASERLDLRKVGEVLGMSATKVQLATGLDERPRFHRGANESLSDPRAHRQRGAS
jgi:prolyl-tRNA editing enzyme YbaK/EbsC (Cys-tRNA(Pro) deacylase)